MPTHTPGAAGSPVRSMPCTAPGFTERFEEVSILRTVVNGHSDSINHQASPHAWWPRVAGLLAAGMLMAESPGEAPRSSEASAHWAYQPIRRPAVPGVGHPVDAFVRSTLEASGLAPNPPADERTLVRRLSFDLLGLPLSPEETEAYLADPAADRYERLVDRLLASPRHGERWARHWLDVVRYTESQGFEYDHLRNHAWPYRDYVIQSFNQDKPY
ncbi:MAG: DUF1549 domain-containing protein, partial [Verrucomicrobia bacterium]|nr:DUF1549 domain-containing protein [Verrucomicrobiota bacterium]